MQDEDFEWDDAKASTNLRRHKISFREARRVFDDMFVVIDQDTSQDYGENRFLATGLVEGLLIVVV